MPDREKVINALERCEPYELCYDDSCPYYRNAACLEKLRQNALALLKEREAVVRCKDCKHLEHIYALDELNGKKCYVCRKHAFTGLRDEDWFCADGERRTDDAGQR